MFELMQSRHGSVEPRIGQAGGHQMKGRAHDLAAPLSHVMPGGVHEPSLTVVGSGDAAGAVVCAGAAFAGTGAVVLDTGTAAAGTVGGACTRTTITSG